MSVRTVKHGKAADEVKFEWEIDGGYARIGYKTAMDDEAGRRKRRKVASVILDWGGKWRSYLDSGAAPRYIGRFGDVGSAMVACEKALMEEGKKHVQEDGG